MTIRLNGSYKASQTTITIEVLSIYSSRMISSKLYRICVNIEDVEDMLAKCDRLSNLEDSMYIDLSIISNN